MMMSEDYRERNQEALDRFRELRYNWDSYQGLPINPLAIDIAQKLIPVLPEWQVVPRSDGGIQFDGPLGEICIEANEVSCDDPPACIICGGKSVMVGIFQPNEGYAVNFGLEEGQRVVYGLCGEEEVGEKTVDKVERIIERQATRGH